MDGLIRFQMSREKRYLSLTPQSRPLVVNRTERLKEFCAISHNPDKKAGTLFILCFRQEYTRHLLMGGYLATTVRSAVMRPLR